MPYGGIMRNFLLMLAIGVSISLSTAALQPALSDDNNAESVADYWFRTKILQQEPDTKNIVIDQQACQDNQNELGLLWDNISEKLMSPLRTFVHYVDRFKTTIASVTTPRTAEPEAAYQGIVSAKEYVAAAIPEIRQKLAQGYEPTSLNFSEVQKLPFVKKITLAGEEVHLCGIDSVIENLIIENLFKHLREHGLAPLHLYYYGSRVMPRSEVVKRDQRVGATMPINDDGVMKNAVRIKGLTHISDLEMMVLVSTSLDYSEKGLKKVGAEFKQNFAKIFRDFPVSVKLIQVKDLDSLPEDPFDFINQVFEETRNKPMSRYQFVKI
jgi:hypothetical protein